MTLNDIRGMQIDEAIKALEELEELSEALREDNARNKRAEMEDRVRSRKASIRDRREVKRWAMSQWEA